MYFIEDGAVSIRIQQDEGEIEISVLGKGQYFGELALVTHRPRAASAYAADNVKVACKWLFFYRLSISHPSCGNFSPLYFYLYLFPLLTLFSILLLFILFLFFFLILLSIHLSNLIDWEMIELLGEQKKCFRYRESSFQFKKKLRWK